jgi:glycosyltransferase involved in cell wall biosynthesis
MIFNPRVVPLDVLHVVLSMDLGGLERVVLDLVRAGLELGQCAGVACIQQRGILASEVEALGVPVACLGKRSGTRLGTIGQMKSLLRAFQPEVVHTHQAGALFYAGAAARGLRMPLVVHTEHGKHYPGRLRSRILGRLSAQFAARYFCVSREIASAVIAHRIAAARKVRVIPNGIDTARFANRGGHTGVRDEFNIPAQAPVIGTVGRLNEIKCQGLLIEALGQIRRAGVDAHLMLVGDGPMEGALRARAEELGLGAWVHFAGYCAAPERLFHAFDVFALTSRSEGMPLVVLEAAAAGLPVIATRVGGLPDVIDHGRTGMLVEAGDLAALVEGLSDLIANPERARLMGEAGRRRVDSEFTLRAMAQRYEQHYRELLAGSRARAGRPRERDNADPGDH